MARTTRKDNPNPHRKESKPYRKTHYRAIRYKVKAALRNGDEPEPYAYRTCGHLTH